METSMKINESVVLISGANRGIGRAFVAALLERGAHRIYATARTVSTLDPVVRLCPARIHPLALDVTSAVDARAAAALASDVGLLINNAAVATLSAAADMPLDVVRESMETNFFGLLNVTKAFIPVLERRRGAIVNMLSVAALASAPALAAYNASKAAGWSLTQSLRADLGKRGVSVFGVFPGPVDTDMTRSLDVPKTPAIDVARATLDGVEAGREDIFPDPMAQQLYAAWRLDHKAVERQFAARPTPTERKTATEPVSLGFQPEPLV
jgi:NAD(P)-dependent dehydrogenase (short-subunit alcohol dehydrogenase family)